MASEVWGRVTWQHCFWAHGHMAGHGKDMGWSRSSPHRGQAEKSPEKDCPQGYISRTTSSARPHTPWLHHLEAAPSSYDLIHGSVNPVTSQSCQQKAVNIVSLWDSRHNTCHLDLSFSNFLPKLLLDVLNFCLKSVAQRH